MKKTRLILSLALLTLFVAYQASISMFAHAHIVNGTMIVHSHPSSDSHHTHTTGQIIAIAQLGHFVSTTADAIALPAPQCHTVHTEQPCAQVSAMALGHVHCDNLRAPPCC